MEYTITEKCNDETKAMQYLEVNAPVKIDLDSYCVDAKVYILSMSVYLLGLGGTEKNAPRIMEAFITIIMTY